MNGLKEAWNEIIMPMLVLFALLGALIGTAGFGAYSTSEYMSKRESVKMAEKLGVVYQGRIDGNSIFIDEETGYVYDEESLKNLRVVK